MSKMLDIDGREQSSKIGPQSNSIETDDFSQQIVLEILHICIKTKKKINLEPYFIPKKLTQINCRLK